MKKNILILVLICLILIVLGGITYYVSITPNDRTNSDASSTLSVNEEKIFTDLEGQTLNFEAFEGKTRVVNVWASWNPFSVQELQDLNAVAGEYKEKDVVFLAINRKEPKEIAQRFLSTLPPLPNLTFIIDQSDSFYSSVGGYAMPETVFYDNSGKITFHKQGVLSPEDLRRYIEGALQKQ